MLGLAACHRSARQPVVLDAFQPVAAVTLHCPVEASPRGPIPLDVTMVADARTYWDNQGLIDEALQVIVVRRDSPGLMAIASTDPAAIMQPTPALPGRPSDEAMARDQSRITQQKQFDLAPYVRPRAGASAYFVVSTFSDAWAGPYSLKVVDSAGRPMSSADGTGIIGNAEAWTEPTLATRGVAIRMDNVVGTLAVVGSFRAGAANTEKPEMFATIVLAPLRPKGGLLSGQFRLLAKHQGDDVVGGFAVPLSMLVSRDTKPDPGRYVLFAFVGDEAAKARVFQIP